MLNYLRIAVTVLSLAACVLVIALWVRSYWIVDVLEKRATSQLFRLESQTSRLSFWQINRGAGRRGFPPEINQILLNQMEMGRFYGHRPVDDNHDKYWHQASVLAFGRFGDAGDRVIFIPHWFPVLIFAAMAALPWIRWSRRFSLRTLLIGMTVIAVVLGIVTLSN